jgi:hypothetical protein
MVDCVATVCGEISEITTGTRKNEGILTCSPKSTQCNGENDVSECFPCLDYSDHIDRVLTVSPKSCDLEADLPLESPSEQPSPLAENDPVASAQDAAAIATYFHGFSIPDGEEHYQYLGSWKDEPSSHLPETVEVI